MKFHDISPPISPAMPVYEGDPPVEVTLSSSIEKGDSANVSRLKLGAHTGSHVDAPRHFLRDGSPIDKTPLDVLIGPALVVELTGIEAISRRHLLGRLQGEPRVLLKTSNSALWREEGFCREFVHIAPDAAEHLVEAGVKLVGIDYLSVEQFGAPEHRTHLTLLRAGVVVVEGLNLFEVAPGRYHLICLPLKVQDCDGAPCRAVLVEQ